MPVDDHDVSSLCQQYLRIVHQEVKQSIIQTPQKSNAMTETQGEILWESMEKLLTAFPLSEQDCFLDLGSGSGNLVTQVFLTSPVKEACGIEMREDLHDLAQSIVARIQHDLPTLFANGRKLTLLHGSFFEIPFSTATVAFMNATCFTQDMVLRLGNLLNLAPSIHTVFTSRPLPTLTRLTFKKAVRIECSWDTALCYVYR